MALAIRAQARDELRGRLDGLARSLAAAIRDGWDRAYRESWKDARDRADPRDVDPDRPDPDAVGLARVRRITLAGSDLSRFVAGPVNLARERIGQQWGHLVMLAWAQSPDLARSLDRWEEDSSNALAGIATRAILTGSYRADAMASRDILIPGLVHPDPTYADHLADGPGDVLHERHE